MSEHEPEATPEQQAQVRRLLAGARHDAPVPPDVATRLDEVLATLAAENRDPGGAVPAPAPVTDLASRRRRRAGRLLLAAAAVVVAGVGLGQVVGTAGDGDSAEDSGISSALDDADAEAEAGGSGGDLDRDPSSGPSPYEAPQGANESDTSRAGAVPRLTTTTFSERAAGLQQSGGFIADGAAPSLVEGLDLTRAPMFVCAAADYGTGTLVAVRYNGQPAVLAYRPSVGETQTADLLQCGSGQVLRSTTLPAP